MIPSIFFLFKSTQSIRLPSPNPISTMSKLPFFIALALLTLTTADPDPLQDFCIADTSGPRPTYMNGPPCLNPNKASPAHFATSALSKPGNTSTNSFGFSVILTNAQNLPGYHTQGLTMARIDIGPNGLVPPHSHPRASEVTICLKGTILVGFVDTSNRLFTHQLRPGESFVFPKALIHFLYNMDPSDAAFAVSGLSSQNPGSQVMPVASFTSKPRLPDEVLEKAFKITEQDIVRIRRNLGG